MKNSDLLIERRTKYDGTHHIQITHTPTGLAVRGHGKDRCKLETALKAKLKAMLAYEDKVQAINNRR